MLILALFAGLMISRRLTATLAVPLAAITLAVAALLPQALAGQAASALTTLLNDVVEAGILQLAKWVFAVILGAVLATQLKLSGAAERLVRYAAEYAGEDRFRLGLGLLLIIALLFTTLGGLGAVIMVATIALPLLFALGFEPKLAGGLFLLGLSLGGCFNPVNWQAYVDLLNLSASQIVPFASVLAGIFFLVCCAYLALFTISSLKQLARNFALLVLPLILAVTIGWLIWYQPGLWHAVKIALCLSLLALLCLLTVALILRLVMLGLSLAWPRIRSSSLLKPDNWLTGAAMLVPLCLLLWTSLQSNIYGSAAVVQIPILSALACGVIYCALASWTPAGGNLNRLMRALFEGVTQAGPAVMLLIGIGILLKATALPAVASSLKPWIAALPLNVPAGFIIVFTLLSPLAMYRGPLNLYGMGAGLMELLAGTGERLPVGIISGSQVLAPVLVMVAFFAVGMLQGVCDPTNTHNVWIANYCKVPTAELTRITWPWVLVVVLLGLLAGAIMFRASFTG